jgi:putative hydrolase of the HAD superfamily
LQQLCDQGYKLGIVTNGTVRAQSVKIKQAGLADLVDEIVISEQEQVRKPDPRIFIRAVDRLGVKAQVCMFVGDNPQADIYGAHQVGMKTVWYAHGFQWPADVDAWPDYVINDLVELLPILLESSQ